MSVPVSPVLFDMSSLGKGRIKNIINTIFSVYLSSFKCDWATLISLPKLTS